MRPSVLLLAFALACGSSPPPPRARPAAEAHAAPSAPPTDPRQLPRNATYADLVAAAKALDDASAGTSEAGCLLAGREDPYRLHADLALGVRPLPEPPDDLDEAFARGPTPVVVLSVWGPIGAQSQTSLALAAITATPSTPGPATVLVRTDRGVYVRETDAPGNEPPIPLASVRGRVEGAALVFITAEAAIPVSEIAELLDALASRERVVGLAAALAPGTPLPAPVAAPVVHIATCERLPDPPAGQDEGELSETTLRDAVANLRPSIQRCAESGTRAAEGRVSIAFRVAADGAVSDACVTEDLLGEPVVVACVADAIRAARFPAPSPAGYVDVQVPFMLASVDPVQRSRCE